MVEVALASPEIREGSEWVPRPMQRFRRLQGHRCDTMEDGGFPRKARLAIFQDLKLQVEESPRREGEQVYCAGEWQECVCLGHIRPRA